MPWYINVKIPFAVLLLWRRQRVVWLARRICHLEVKLPSSQVLQGGLRISELQASGTALLCATLPYCAHQPLCSM